MLSLQKLVDSFINDDFFGYGYSKSENQQSENFCNPNTDISQKEDQYEICIDVPGVDKEDISISFEKGVLLIEAEKKEKDYKDRKYLYRNRFYGKYIKKVLLDEDINMDNIDASLDSGVLSIKLSKLKKAEKTLKIDIK